MNSSSSMNDLLKARTAVESEQRKIWSQLGLALPEAPPKRTANDFEDYLNANPDYTKSEIESFAKQFAASTSRTRSDISSLDPSMASSILTDCVDDLKFACDCIQPSRSLNNVCFGTIPGGGLDAYSFKVHGADEYGIIIPNGLFNLVNLFCRLVVLLQPFTQSEQGLIYLPSASFTQLALASHPYIQFRHRDLLRAYFLHGDPEAALPYLKAIPFQDRWAYLLVGTELYVLAHEASHVLLGHLEEDNHAEHTPELELKADELAHDIVTEFFNRRADFGRARASLCGFMFQSINQMWERTLQRLMTASGHEIELHSHPAHEERFKNFVLNLGNVSGTSTPSWYGFIHNAVALATELLTERALPSLIEEAEGIEGFSSRVFPVAQSSMGHIRPAREEQWWITIAELLLSTEQSSRRLGLWFLLQFSPQSALGLYEGLSNDDDLIRELSKRALVSIEPMYENYLPRLMERFRETSGEGQDLEYKLNLANYLTAMAGVELGERLEQSEPMSPGFFD